MLTKRIVPCLDILNGRTVKGINFVNLRDAGDPVELAERYALEGADELVFLDISATIEQREMIYDLVNRISARINIPFTVGGGIASSDKVSKILRNGADKVSVNSAVVRNPVMAKEISDEFGSQCLVVAVDAKKIDNQWLIHTHGGRNPTDIDLFDWVLKMEDFGAGEILFTSMDHDGTKKGFAVEALARMNDVLSIPVIASGGAGTKEHFLDAFISGKADAALAASVFHYDEIPIASLKKYLSENNVAMRL